MSYLIIVIEPARKRLLYTGDRLASIEQDFCEKSNNMKRSKVESSTYGVCRRE